VRICSSCASATCSPTRSYALPAGASDLQKPHLQDEIYLVVSGRASVTVGEETTYVARGSVVYVPAKMPHRFPHITEELQVLVVFAPPEG
jgi:mannose-6-phosphate isomerase-like protein (cupin superfamily)